MPSRNVLKTFHQMGIVRVKRVYFKIQCIAEHGYRTMLKSVRKQPNFTFNTSRDVLKTFHQMGIVRVKRVYSKIPCIAEHGYRTMLKMSCEVLNVKLGVIVKKNKNFTSDPSISILHVSFQLFYLLHTLVSYFILAFLSYLILFTGLISLST